MQGYLFLPILVERLGRAFPEGGRIVELLPCAEHLRTSSVGERRFITRCILVVCTMLFWTAYYYTTDFDSFFLCRRTCSVV